MSTTEAKHLNQNGMRKRFVILLLLVIVSLLGFAGCTGQPAELTPGLGQEFTLSPGQAVSIKGEPLKISFLEVVSDSRCPTGATCVWQGEASSLVEITYSGSAYRKVLTQLGLTKGPWKTDFQDYEIQFNLQPYPEVGKQIDERDYRLELVIGKMTLSGGILATFEVVGEKYSVFITNKATIEQVFLVQRGESRATIPSGRILRGVVPYNQPWSWHIDSEDISMAEVTIELCDGTPSQVEANLDYWVDTMKYFCPWSAKIAEIKDLNP